MDQTIIVKAQAGAALRIDFAPAQTTVVPIPADVVFIACESWAIASKGTTACDAYNARVVGCRTAALLLGLDPPVLGRFEGSAPDAVAALPEHAVPPDDVRQLTGTLWSEERALPVRSWARHVLSEAPRVGLAEEALAAADVAALGALFDASHRSLADDFGVSTPEVEATVAAAPRARPGLASPEPDSAAG